MEVERMESVTDKITLDWIEEHCSELENFRGKWVALANLGGETAIVGVQEDRDKLLANLSGKGTLPGLLIFYVP